MVYNTAIHYTHMDADHQPFVVMGTMFILLGVFHYRFKNPNILFCWNQNSLEALVAEAGQAGSIPFKPHTFPLLAWCVAVRTSSYVMDAFIYYRLSLLGGCLVMIF